MSIDPNLAVSTKDTGDGTLDFDGPFRIYAINLGIDSAVLGVSLDEPLVVAPKWASNPLGVWKIESFKDGYSLELVASINPLQSGPLYANTTDDNNRVVLGPTPQEFIISGFIAYEIWDPKTKLTWELSEDGHGYTITMKEKKKENTQAWGFRSASLL